MKTSTLKWTAVTVAGYSRRKAARDSHEFIIDSVADGAQAWVLENDTIVDSATALSLFTMRAWCEAWGQPAPAPTFDPWVRQSGAHVRIFEHINHHGWQLRRRRMGWVLYRLMRDDTWYQGAIVGNNEKVAKTRADEIVEKMEAVQA